MMAGGSVNVKVGVKVVRDKEGLHQIRGEQLRQGRGVGERCPDVIADTALHPDTSNEIPHVMETWDQLYYTHL